MTVDCWAPPPSPLPQLGCIGIIFMSIVTVHCMRILVETSHRLSEVWAENSLNLGVCFYLTCGWAIVYTLIHALIFFIDLFLQELMGGEAAKERVTTAYTWVPSKSKLLANELPNKETTSQIKRHSDDIKPTCSVIAMWEVVHSLRTPFDLAAEEWPSEQVTAKAVCLKNA